MSVVASGYPPLTMALPARTVSALTGLSLRQLRYLNQQGLVRPSVRPPAGRGSEGLYAPSDLLALVVIERVRAVCGQEVRTERLRELVERLQARPPRPGQRLILDAEGPFIHEGSVDGILNRTTAALILDLDALEHEVEARLSRLGGA